MAPSKPATTTTTGTASAVRPLSLVPYGCPSDPEQCTCGIGSANLQLSGKITGLTQGSPQAIVTLRLTVEVRNGGSAAVGPITVTATTTGASTVTQSATIQSVPANGSSPVTLTFELAVVVGFNVSFSYLGNTYSIPSLVPLEVQGDARSRTAA